MPGSEVPCPLCLRRMVLRQFEGRYLPDEEHPQRLIGVVHFDCAAPDCHGRRVCEVNLPVGQKVLDQVAMLILLRREAARQIGL